MKMGFGLVLLATLWGLAPALAGDGWDDFMGYYSQRTEGITPGAGNAKEANSAIHAVDPWPANSRNRNIPTSGERMSRAIGRYQDVTKLPEAARTIAPDSMRISSSGAGNGAASGGK